MDRHCISIINVAIVGWVNDDCGSVVESDGQLKVPAQWVEVPGFQRSELSILNFDLSTIPAENYAVANCKFLLATRGFNCDFGMQMPLLG